MHLFTAIWHGFSDAIMTYSQFIHETEAEVTTLRGESPNLKFATQYH